MTETAGRGRFAPSTTGPAHPGTLLSALLTWLDARRRGGAVELRLEDLDRERCRPHFATRMIDDLAWLGLDWDRTWHQHKLRPQHEAALDALDAQGRLYPCRCSRSQLRARARPAADGGWIYDGRCRNATTGPIDWRRQPRMPIRLRLDDVEVAPRDDGGLDLRQNPLRAMGDPVVVRRDGSVAYQLAVVADDIAAGITHLVRGRDLATSAATQWQIYAMLGAGTPRLRHHLLLLETHGGKLAKLHRAVGTDTLRAHYDAPTLCGVLAHWAGLTLHPGPVQPRELVDDFDWRRIRQPDLIVEWGNHGLLAPSSLAAS